jgi:uncharacterized protein
MPKRIQLPSFRLAVTQKALPVLKAGSTPGRGCAFLCAALTLLLLCSTGCSLLNRYVFIPKEEITATPQKYAMEYQEVRFPARDGVQLSGWFLPGATGKPLVLFFHGNAGNVSDNLEYLHLLHGSGFPLFIFDYRGFGQSAGKPRTENDLYQDGRGAVSYLERQGWRRDAMVFFGQSLGSAVALQMALEAPPAGLVLEGSFTSMKEMVQLVSPLAYYTIGWWGIDLPFDNLAKIGRLGVPLLLIHGDQDGVVPVQMTRRLFAEAGAAKMLHIIDQGGHCDVFTRDSSAYLEAWQRYLLSLAPQTARP